MVDAYLDIPCFTPVMSPSSGIVSLPAARKSPRVDFQGDKFDLLIETKGQRLAWSRATECPCAGVNTQTKLSDPNCALCRGSGWFYFSPSLPVTAATVGSLSDVQKAILVRNHGGIIKGIVSDTKKARIPYSALGNWEEGDILITVRAPNKLGHYDKLVSIDTNIVYVEGIVSRGASLPLVTRYLVNQINFVRSFTSEYKVEVDYTLLEGQIYWLPGKAPATGVRVTVHYLTTPTWLVVDHPHAVRSSLVAIKVKDPITPQGSPQDLPIQAHCRLEFLVVD